MSHLDDELKKALDVPAPASRAQPVSTATEPRITAPRPRRWGLLFGIILMGGAVLLVVFTGIDNAAVYSKSVDQLLAERARFQQRHVRVKGQLVPGSLMRRSEPCEYRFKLTEGHEVLEIRYPQCVVPDTFRDVPGSPVEVTAEGRLQADGSFLAQQIMAKCPSKYDMKEQGNRGLRMPSSLGPSTQTEAFRSQPQLALLEPFGYGNVANVH